MKRAREEDDPDQTRKAPSPSVLAATSAPTPPNEEQASLILQPLAADVEVTALIAAEENRQRHWLNLIASENFMPRAVLEAQSSVLANKYSEGYPGGRHYGGNVFVDRLEILCQERALALYNLSPEAWGVNVQCLSGSFANIQVYHALLKPHDRLMGLSLTHGGHMSFGYQTDKLKVSAVSTYFETLPYQLDLSTGRIDYDDLENVAERFRPKAIVAGASSYCRLIDYERLKEICQKVGAYLVVDMAHTAGQVAAGLFPSPYEYADVVTTATHKTLRGPRGAMIFFKKEYESLINFSVFPAYQGGPHNHTIAALAVALWQAKTPAFKSYQRQLMANAKSLEAALVRRGYELVSGGTDIHMVVVSLANKGVDGARVQAACERAHIAISPTAVPGDKWSLPRAVRLGTTPMTTRGFTARDYDRVAALLDKVVNLSTRIQLALPPDANKLRDFKAALAIQPEFDELQRQVTQWTGSLPLPTAERPPGSI